MLDTLHDWILALVVVFLVGTLLESNARAKYAITHYTNRFWHTRYACGRALRWLLDLGCWKQICPDCEGTGLCHHPKPLYPHSCCGACDRTWVPRTSVPPNCDGWVAAKGLSQEETKRRHLPDSETLALIGTGWIEGSFWSMLRNGRWRGRRL